MALKPIRTEDDYQTAVRKASAFFENEPEPVTPEGDCFEILILLIQDYENKHYSVELPDPVEAIEFRMEQSGLTPKDLKPMIGRLNPYPYTQVRKHLKNQLDSHCATSLISLENFDLRIRTWIKPGLRSFGSQAPTHAADDSSAP